MKCKNCQIEEGVKYSKYSTGEFCSKSCACKFSSNVNRAETNKKISLGLKGFKRDTPKFEITCEQCDKKILVKLSKSKQKFCSKSCSSTWLNLNGRGRIAGLASVLSQGRRSKNEIHFAGLCKERFIVLENVSMFNGWDADIILPELKLAVLWNGAWHYKKITGKHSIKQVQNRDTIKLKEIEAAGYKSYVIKDMGKYDKNFVEEKFKEMLVYLKL